MSLAINSYYQLLDLARDRPGMYGIGAKSYPLLQSFINGLSYANLGDGDPPFYDFGGWVSIRTNHCPTSNPFHWLRDLPDKEGYETWFRLLDEYRACRVVELSRLPGSVVRLREQELHKRDKTIERYTPPTPQFVRIGRYAPSDVYFIEQLFENRIEYKGLDDFYPSVEDAIRGAELSWQVPSTAWVFENVED